MMRARVASLLGVAVIAASCGSTIAPPTATSSPTSTIRPDAAPTATSTDAPTAAPTGTSAASGRWEATGSMALARGVLRAVLLGDGRVLVVGNDEDDSCVRPDSVQSEIWNPASGTWSAGPSLNAPRAEFAAVPAGDGGALVTGGVTAGITDDWDAHQSYSSTYVYDPAATPPTWSRQGLLDRARTLPIAATLLDGRVLVAGGYYLSGNEEGSLLGVVLAVYLDPSGESPSKVSPPGDVAPPRIAPTFATAELFDPATGSWSETGPMRFARVAAPAVTLTDGRVLVVGSAGHSGQGYLGPGRWNYSVPAVDDRAYETGEIYDPSAGRFTLTGDLPAVDWSPLAKWGPYPVESGGVADSGTLVALADGGALLVGQVTSWSIRAHGIDGSTVRTLRYDPAADSWTLIDQRISGGAYSADDPAPEEVLVDGHSRPVASAVGLHDGRVLIVGDGGFATELYDPATGTWSAVTQMPAPRASGAAVLLRDGSVLVVGGPGRNPDDEKLACNQDGTCQCGDDSTGLANAIRFIPAP